MIAAILILLVLIVGAAGALYVLHMRGDIYLPFPGGTYWKHNVMAAYTDVDTKQEENNKVFSSSVPKSTVRSIEFFDTVKDAPSAAWDVSENNDRSVLAWMNGDRLCIAGKGGVSAPKNCNNLFCAFVNAESIEFNGCFHTENVTTMNSMFWGCKALKTLDLTGFDTSNVTDLNTMFNICESLQRIYGLNGFRTEQVTDMSYLFAGDYALQSIDLSSFNTSAVGNMRHMFHACEKLTQIDVSNFDTSDVADMSYMFCGCKALQNLDLSGFDTSNVTTMEAMFRDCASLISVDVSGFHTASVINMSSMFAGDIVLRDVNVNSFDTSKVRTMNRMFYNCGRIPELDISSFTTEALTDASYFFYKEKEYLVSGQKIVYRKAGFKALPESARVRFMNDETWDD